MAEPDAAEIEVSRLQANGLSYREAWDLVRRADEVEQDRVERALMDDGDDMLTARQWADGMVRQARQHLAADFPRFFPDLGHKARF